MMAQVRKTSLTLLTLLLLLSATGWLQPVAHGMTLVQAATENTYWARWTMEMDFANNEVNARWTVFIGGTDEKGQMFITKQKSESIACAMIGNVKIDQEEAFFDGASHLACPIPSFYDTVVALTDGKMPFPDTIFSPQTCKCQNPRPWVAADVTIATPTGVFSPLVYQVDNAMQFAVIRDNDMVTSHLSLNDGVPVPETLKWPVNLEQGNQLWSGSGTPNFLVTTDPQWYQFLTADFYTVAKQLSLDDYLHWADATPQGLVFSHAADFHMTNQPTTFLVGYNGRSHFIGKIKKLAWDPPCGPQDGK